MIGSISDLSIQFSLKNMVLDMSTNIDVKAQPALEVCIHPRENSVGACIE